MSEQLIRDLYESTKQIIETNDYYMGSLILDYYEIEKAHREAAAALGLPLANSLYDGNSKKDDAA